MIAEKWESNLLNYRKKEYNLLLFCTNMIYIHLLNIFSIPNWKTNKKYLNKMFKIKSHYRHKSQENLIQEIKITDKIKETFLVKDNQKIVGNTGQKIPNTIQKIHNLQKIKTIKQCPSSRNSMGDLHSDRNKVENQLSFQNDLKKFNKSVQVLSANLSDILKQLNQQLYRKKIITETINLINIQNSAQDIQAKQRTKNDDQITSFIFIPKQKASINKIQNQINKTRSFNKNLQQQIENERKNRQIFENHLYKIEKEIKQQQNIYAALLMKSVDSKFLYFLTVAEDVVTNGHMVGLKKQTQEENDKQLQRNMYMCMPTAKSSSKQIQNQSFRKSSKCIGKNGSLKKLVKILSFVESSKALQQSELQLYHQQEILQAYSSKGKGFSSFFTLTNPDNAWKGNTSNSLGRKIPNKGRKYNPRSGKIVSIKFISDRSLHYEQNLQQIIFELFQLYQSLQINIFAKKIGQVKNQNGNEDFFNFDQDQLVEQSERRLQFMQQNKEKITTLNGIIQSKILLAEERIHQTQNLIYQIQKNSIKKKQKQCEQKDENSIDQENLQNINIFKELLNIFSIESNKFNVEEQVQNIIDKLLFSLNQTQQEEITKKQHKSLHNFQVEILNSGSKKQTYVQTQDSQKEKKKQSYIKSIAKTQGNEKKFHRLVREKDEQMVSKASLSCRSIFQNGAKSLNNIIDNMQTMQSYQRVFERQEFQKQYTKEIKKKKRVMFRRQAKVLTTMAQ